MNLIKKIACSSVLFMSALSLTACHQRVEPVSEMDKQLSCSKLKEEIKSAENAKNKIASNRGISGRNALGLLFWPSIVVNEVTGESAEKEATTRLTELKNIYVAKQCSKDVVEKSQKG